MALIIKDRVKETASVTGTGGITLLGAASNFRSFADIGNGNTTFYCISDQGGADWEVGIGTYASAGNMLARTTVLSNSLGTTALISFTGGTKDIFSTYPASQAVIGGGTASGTNTGDQTLPTLASLGAQAALGFTPYNSTNPSGYITSAGTSAACSGNAATATSADNIDGIAFKNAASTSTFVVDTQATNGIGYSSGYTLFGQSDGGVYASTYDSQWQHQINGDFRTGQIAIRGKSANVWGAWRVVLDSTNYSSYSTFSGDVVRTGIAYGDIYLTGSLPGYAANSYPTLKSNAALYFSADGAYSAYITGTTVVSRGALNSTTSVNCGTDIFHEQNYGYGQVSLYNAGVFQAMYSMGTAYRLGAGGLVGNLYGTCWSHPNAGGAAANLDSHGQIVLINGGFGSCMSYSIKASANVTAYSDERLKTNWKPLADNFVAKLAEVRVGTYDRIDQSITQVGVSAQSLESLMPEAVITGNDEMRTKSVSYGNAALAAAVMIAKEMVEMKSMIEELKAEIAILKGNK